MSSSEAVLWTIERDPVLRSTIVVVCLLARAPDPARLRERLAAVADAFPRLRQRVRPGRAGPPHWVDQDGFDVDHHVLHVRLPAPGTMRQLLDLAGGMAGDAFDPARPLWQATVVDGLEDGRAALVLKLHHAVTDGQGGIALLPILTDTAPDCRRLDGDRAGARSVPSRPLRRSGPERVLRVAMSTAGSVAAHPSHAVATTPRLARSVGKMLAPAGHALSPLATERGLDRRLTIFDVHHADLAAAATRAGGTLNDAFLAAVVGGLRRYHEEHGFAVDQLRVTMPISTRREGDEAGGNRFTPARFVVPAAIADPVERMQVLGDLARGWRSEPAVGLTDVLAGVLAHLPGEVTTSLFGSMLKGVDFVATNVAGSRQRVWLAGAEVERIYGFAPPSGAAVNVALLSHVDTCCIGINVDTSAIPDADHLTACIQDGFKEVIAAHDGIATVPSMPPAPRVAAVAGDRPVRLSALDTSFLALERTGLPMHVGALLVLDGAPLLDESGHVRIDALRTEIAARLDRCPRMRQRAMPVPFDVARPVWVDDPAFEIAHHVHSIELDPPGGRRQLIELCAELQTRVLERAHPLWEMWFVGGLTDGTVGLVYKVHHALVDGVSAAETFRWLLGSEAPPTGARRAHGIRSTPSALLGGALVDGPRTAAGLARAALGAAVHPRDSLVPAAGVARLLRERPLAPRSPLNAPVGPRRQLREIGLDVAELKAVGRRFGATVNDVVLALVASGLHAMLVARGDAPTGDLHALVPVSLRSPGDERSLGNRVTALVVHLPVGDSDVRSRLAAITAETTRRKSGPEGAGMELLLRSAEAWPMPVLALAGRLVERQPFVNLVVTNVRGPDEPLVLLGAEIREIIPIVPLGANLALGVAAFSYRGRLAMGIHSDADGDFDLDAFAGGVHAALATLMRRRQR